MRIDDERSSSRGTSGPAVTTSGRAGARHATPTSKDVARAAGVSQSTVSYVMSGKRPISDATRKVVMAAIDRLTYEPHAGARALAGQRTKVVGLVMPFHDTHSAGGLMAFAEQIALSARERDHDILMLTSQEGPAGLARVSRRAMCDAAILMEIALDDPRAAMARQLQMPIIFIGVPSDRAGLHCIDFDFEAGARLLVDALCEAGADEIGVLGWDAVREQRCLNYVPRFRDSAELRCSDHGVRLAWHTPAGEGTGVDAALDRALEGAGRPALLVTQGLSEVSAALERRGLEPGRDVDVVALATDAEAEGQRVPTTAVSPQPRDVSRQAMTWLFELLDGDTPPGLRLVEASLAQRSSVRGSTA